MRSAHLWPESKVTASAIAAMAGSPRRCRVRGRFALGASAPLRRRDLGGSWLRLHQLLWRADDRRHEPSCRNRLLDLATHDGVRKVTEIPGQQVVDSVRPGSVLNPRLGAPVASSSCPFSLCRCVVSPIRAPLGRCRVQPLVTRPLECYAGVMTIKARSSPPRRRFCAVACRGARRLACPSRIRPPMNVTK